MWTWASSEILDEIDELHGPAEALLVCRLSPSLHCNDPEHLLLLQRQHLRSILKYAKSVARTTNRYQLEGLRPLDTLSPTADAGGSSAGEFNGIDPRNVTQASTLHAQPRNGGSSVR